MQKSFEEALYDLVGEYSRNTSTDALISAMDLSIMALEEEGGGVEDTE